MLNPSQESWGLAVINYRDVQSNKLNAPERMYSLIGQRRIFLPPQLQPVFQRFALRTVNLLTRTNTVLRDKWFQRFKREI